MDLHKQEPHSHDCLAYLARVRRRFGKEVCAKAVATAMKYLHHALREGKSRCRNLSLIQFCTNRFIIAHAFFPTRLLIGFYNLRGLLQPLSIVAFSESSSRLCNAVAQTTAACSPKTQKPQKTQEMDVLYIVPLTARERGRLPLRRPENHPTDPTRPEPNRLTGPGKLGTPQVREPT